MNILIFSQRFWPENFRINKVAQKLSKKNNLIVFTEKPNYPNGKIKKKYLKNSFYIEKWKKIQINRIPTISRGNSKLKLFLNYLNFILLSPFFLNKNYVRKNIDIIFIYATSPIFQAIPAIIFGKINKIPTVLWVQDIWPDVLKDLNIINNNFILSLIKFFVKKIYKYSDYIFVQSYSFKKKISKLTNTNVDILYNPEIRQKKKKSLKKRGKKFIVTYAGNLGKAQSLDTLINAVKKINNLNLEIHIYGDGSEKIFFKNKIKKLNLNKYIKLFKPVTKIKIDKILSKSDAFLLILGKGDGLSSTLPAKLQSYLSHKKPIIVSANGESYNFVSKNNLGLVSKAEDSEGLLRSIILTKNLKQSKLALIGRQSSRVFENNFEINKWTKILEQKLEKYAEAYKRRLF